MAKTEGKKKKSNAEKKAAKQRKLEEAARKAEEEHIASEQKAKEEAEAAAALTAKLALERRKTVKRLVKELNAESKRLHLKSGQCLIEESISSSKEEWMRYTACNYLPDVASEAEINTFLSELLDVPSIDMVEALSAVHKLSKLSHELRRRVLGTALMEHRKENACNKCQAEEMLQQIRNAALRLLDLQTADVITHWNKYNAIGIIASDNSGEGVEEIGGGDETPSKASDRDYLSFQNNDSNFLLGIWYNLRLHAFRLKNIDFGRGFNIGIPKPLSTARVALRILYLPSALNSTTSHPFFSHKDLSISDDELPHCTPRPRFKQLGGTLYLEILPLPPPAETIGDDWTFRRHTNIATPTTRLSYPLGGGNILAVPPLCVSFPIPEFILLHMSKSNNIDDDGSSILDNNQSNNCNTGLTVAAWDEKLNEWNTNGINDIEWNEKRRNVRFQTYRIGALALAKGWNADLPYREWYIQPVYEPLLGISDMSDPTMEVEIRLVTARGHELQFRVRAGTIKLISPDLPPLAPILGIWMAPGSLLLSLSDAGIDILPRHSDAHEVMGGIHLARPLENSLYRNVSELASSFYIRYGCDKEHLIKQMVVYCRKHYGIVTLVQQTNYCCSLKRVQHSQQQLEIHVFPESSLPADVTKYCLLKARIDPVIQLELDNPLAQRHEESHIRLLDCLAAISEPESIKRVENTSPRLTKTIHQILHSVKLFSFTKYQPPIETSSSSS